MTTSELPSLRHPLLISKDNEFFFAATDYVPDPALDTGLIKGHPWGCRQDRKTGHIQYMVYDAKGRNVLTCQYTPEMAAQKAIERVEYEQRTPESYSARLAGWSFGKKVPNNSAILIHTVVDENGCIMGEHHYREEAARHALSNRLAMHDVQDMSFEEFCLVNFAAPVLDYGRDSSARSMYADGDGEHRAKIRAVLDNIWKTSEHGKLLYPGESSSAFVTAIESHLLQQAGEAKAEIMDIRLNFDDGKRRVNFLFTKTHLVTPKQALRHAYKKYQEQNALVEAELPAVERQRG